MFETQKRRDDGKEKKALSSRNMRKGRGKELYESEKGGKLGRYRF